MNIGARIVKRFSSIMTPDNRRAVLFTHKGNMAFSQKGRMCDLKAMEKTLKRFDYEVKIDVLV